MIRREVLDAIGLFDEKYNFWYEDVDLCHRALNAGWESWFVPEASILHRGGASWGLLDSGVRALWRFRNMMRYARSYFTPGKFLALRGIVAGVLLIRLPIVFAAGFWPGVNTRKTWKGAWKDYLKLLREVVLNQDR